MNTFEKDSGKMIQVVSAPLSEALITVDSRDGIKYNTTTGLVSASKNPFDININIGTQFFGSGVRRLRLKEALLTWNIPNVNPTNNTLFLEKEDGTLYSVVVPDGFYTPNELATFIQNNLNSNVVFGNTDWTVFYYERGNQFFISTITNIQITMSVETVSGTAGTYNNWIVKDLTTGTTEQIYESETPVVGTNIVLQNVPSGPPTITSWNVGDSIQITTPISSSTGDAVILQATGKIISYAVSTTGTPPRFRILPYNNGGLTGKLTSTLATMMGFSTVNDSYIYSVLGSHASMLYTEYVDIVSSQLTKNQTLYDRSTNYRTGNNLLARLYISPDRLYSTTSTNIIGTRPFILDKPFDTPKEINWDSTDPLASINIQLRDSRGNLLYAPDTSTVSSPFFEKVGNTGYVLLTLGASEASGV